MSANRLATLLGALILLSLILYLATAIRRRKNAVQATGAKAKVRPKYSPNELDELPGTAANVPVFPKQSATEQPPSAPITAALAQNQPWVLTNPTIVLPTAAAAAEHTEHRSGQEEREVFEL